MVDEDTEGFVNEQQFWAELHDIATTTCTTHEAIDDTLRSFVDLATRYKQEHLQSEYDIAKCCYLLLDAPVFRQNEEYVRRQLLFCVLQEDDVDTLHLAAALLLFDGRANEVTFEMMQTESAFPRLVELIRERRDDNLMLHRLLLELLFAMSRIQRLAKEDLMTVDDSFILYLFQLIEHVSDDADDPYHYPVIKVLLILNEQYMVLASTSSSPQPDQTLTNRILKILSMHGPSYRTFGENLILLLNRESALGPQLLILKLLYLLFTTASTYEYFYTNDLHVLVDVIIRNLLDLEPGLSHSHATAEDIDRDGQRALRHTYLRVLCPLLKNTQLAKEGNNYKREEVRKLLGLLVNRSSAHFAPVDDTVLRLVVRCKDIEWIKDENSEQDQELDRKLANVAPSEKDVANKLLGISLQNANESSLSVVDLSAKVTKEKPTAPAPRRNKRKKHDGSTSSLKSNGTGQAGLAVPIAQSPTEIERERSPFADDTEEP